VVDTDLELCWLRPLERFNLLYTQQALKFQAKELFS
jgi:hypothetical protein